jgi:predicted GIY-YIG superfamily endonuclease
LAALLAMQPLSHGSLSADMPQCGVYLFSERDNHLYVGRSNDLRGRYGRHCRPGATHRQAAFAFELARRATGRIIRSYKPDENRRDALMAVPEFKAAFIEAKERIRNMDYRFVEEAGQNCQALLEIYCSIVLATPYNDFRTH